MTVSKKYLWWGVVLVVLIAVAYGLSLFSPAYTLNKKTDTYTLSISVPQTDNDALNASLASYLDAMAREFDEMYGPDAFSADEYEVLGFADGRRYELSITGSAWEYSTLDGVVLERYTDTGGAHGSTDYIQFLYDEAGTPLSLGALFIEDTYLERIANVIRPRLREKLEAEGAFLEDMFEAGTAPDPGNYMVYTIDESGFTFFFQQYQVAPYAYGAPQVVVPLDALQDILNPTYF